MNLSNRKLWERFQSYYSEYPKIGLAMDLSRMNFSDDFISGMLPKLDDAFAEMAELEKGAIANPDENRMVGHYWLRNPALAPTPEIRAEIESTIAAVKTFAQDVHTGKIQGVGGPFKTLLLIGIGGSALGPQFVANALGEPKLDKLTPFFFDNTDPDGMDRVLARIGNDLNRTLCITVSKSGGTKETRNGMLEAEAAYKRVGLSFEKHAIAITSEGSELDKTAAHWLKRFPMWDWVGGRTSELSSVGLVPAALQGIDVDSILRGARECDEVTRARSWKQNPAAQLALMWFYIGNGKGEKNMVVLPYKDRLELFSKYLQQLLMESLGKAQDRSGKTVHQGISVFGNKGSTDQHSYVQQLRDGRDNFFVTFIEVLKDRSTPSMLVEPEITSGDFLHGFLLGTRAALYQKGRESLSIMIDQVTPHRVGVLIALYERAVGLYASLININAYHQPGVEAGKKAASEVIALEHKVLAVLAKEPRTSYTADEIATQAGAEAEAETIFKIIEHLAANDDRKIARSTADKLSLYKYKLS
jgi:glucose-6-phosphate isomerase